MINTIITAIISFVSTNIDDIFVLMLLFSQVNKELKIRHIVTGQFLGIGTLTIISIIGALGVSSFRKEYMGLLGLVPIYLGIKLYIEHINEKNEANDLNDSSSSIEDTTETEENSNRNKWLIPISYIVNPSILKVAGITIANGGDNIGIYTPLLANMNILDILATIAIFAILTAIWCLLGYKLSDYSFIRNRIERYKHILVPIIFIALGIFIIMENKTISIFF